MPTTPTCDRPWIGQVEVGYEVPVLNLVGEKTRADVMMTFSGDPAETAQVNAPVMNIVEKVSAFKLQTRALQDLASGDVGGATHYHADYVKPRWSRRLRKMDVIGRHIFYQLRAGQT